uniref:Carboxylic ester hydrolase n=1 Tax=Timema douglasi TaxID=61478 RepID=A0A7R8VGW7_TIMDO|nr:unnamed protein product [Timema douglasi]
MKTGRFLLFEQVTRAMCDLEDGMETVIVNVAQGALRGRKVNSRPGSPYYSFQGIPYAKPPVGSRRFKSPEPMDPWRGERDSLEEGSICIHFDMLMKQLRGVEDCLFLNVPDGGSTALKAVMVWIHGGGFTMGSGNIDFYGPDYFVHADVILVTFNYRLGALGFLCLNDTNVSANNGLKDQVAVLRWVQQNIAQFGGDPDNVTIFGESAGAASVHYHLLSPMSKGLFHRAIAQSGSVLNPWAFIESSRTRAFRLGELLGCKTDDAEELVRFLRGVTAKSIVEAQENTLTPEEKVSGLVFPFLPEVESEGPHNFLPKKPLELIKSGSIHEVPLIMGMTSHEGLISLQALGRDQAKALNGVEKNFDRFVPEDLVDKNSTRSAEISNKIRQLYFKDEPVSEKTLPQYIDLVTDTWFGAGIYRAVKEHVASCRAPLYYYQFPSPQSSEGTRRLLQSSPLLLPVPQSPSMRCITRCWLQLVTDTWFGAGIYRAVKEHVTSCRAPLYYYQFPSPKAVKEHVTSCRAPLYYYQFAFDGQLGIFKRMLGVDFIKGVCHGDDLGYLFTSKLNSGHLDPSTPEMKVLSLMVELWTSFARDGIPRAEKVSWLPVTESDVHCLTIDSPPRTGTDPHKDRASLWTELYSDATPTSQG